MAEKLFYSDQYMKSFTSRVVSCEGGARGYEAILEKTAFYPEGGGQPGDTGALGTARVIDTVLRGNEIIHVLDAPLEPGSEVSGEVDLSRRFDFMQQHSGEHIVSGLINAAKGYHNTGFHMGAEVVTIDFDGELSEAELAGIERAANEIVWRNVEISAGWYEGEELRRISYRSKKPLEGSVRIVAIPGADVCACCGTHVARTGEIGLIKLLGSQRLRGGVRLELVCGARAYDYASRIIEENRGVSRIFSAKPLETAAAAQRMHEELEALKYRLTGLEMQRFAAIARENAGASGAVLFEDGLDADSVRRLADAVMAENSGVCAVFSRSGDGGFKYAVGQRQGDVCTLVREMNAALSGRGGGRGGFAQGSLSASRGEIEAFFAVRPSQA